MELKMIEKLKLVNPNQEKGYFAKLHPDATNILFEHRRYVKNIFLQIKGHYETAHFGINFINPSNELVTFSSTPHIEYNLMKQELWKNDPCFSSKILNKNMLYWWEDIYPDTEINLFGAQIKQIKLVSNSFSTGLTLCREIDGFYFLYSYATRSSKKNLQEYYISQIFNLIDIGDYFCKSILDVYSEYCGNHTLPQLHQLNSKASDLNIRSTLKLVVNNS
jgi:hypothetical protein